MLDGDHGVGSAHVCQHPAGVEGDRGDAAPFQVHGEALHHHVGGGFAAAIQVTAAAAVVIHAAHLAGDGDDAFELAARDLLDERFDHLQRGHGVDVECVHPFRVVGMAEAFPVRCGIHACIVDEQVDRLAGKRARQLFDLRMVGDVECVHFDLDGILLRQFVQRIRLARVATAGDDAPACCDILFAELEADAAIGTCDQHGLHVRSLWFQPEGFYAEVCSEIARPPDASRVDANLSAGIMRHPFVAATALQLPTKVIIRL